MQSDTFHALCAQAEFRTQLLDGEIAASSRAHDGAPWIADLLGGYAPG